MALDSNSVQGVLNQLNTFLAHHSYISGYTPSKADASLFKAIGRPLTGNYRHIQRWYRHIASYDESERANWEGVPLHKAAGDRVGVCENTDSDAIDYETDYFSTDEEEDNTVGLIKRLSSLTVVRLEATPQFELSCEIM